MAVTLASTTYAPADQAGTIRLLVEIAEVTREIWTGADSADFAMANGAMTFAGAHRAGEWGWEPVKPAAGVKDDARIHALNYLARLAGLLDAQYTRVRTEVKEAVEAIAAGRSFSVQLFLGGDVPYSVELAPRGIGVSFGD